MPGEIKEEETKFDLGDQGEILRDFAFSWSSR